MRVALWRAVCFHNLVLELMDGIAERPEANDYLNGWNVFFDMIGIMKPTHCLFAGTDYHKTESFHTIARERNVRLSGQASSAVKISRVIGSKLDVSLDNLSCRIVFIMHPGCRNFSWRKWSPFTHQFLPAFPSEVTISSL